MSQKIPTHLGVCPSLRIATEPPTTTTLPADRLAWRIYGNLDSRGRRAPIR